MTEILGPQKLPKCIKTHVQASIIQKFSRVDPQLYPNLREGEITLSCPPHSRAFGTRR